MNRSIGAYDTFLDVDHGARAAYEVRIASEKQKAESDSYAAKR